MKFSACFAAAIVTLAVSGPASAAELFNLGSTFTISGTNAPNNFSQTVTLGAGSTTIDGGALTLTQSFVNVAGGEWFVLDLLAPTNSLIFGNINANWQVSATGITASQLVTGIQAYYDFGLSCGGVSCGLESPNACWTATCTIETNPVAGFPQVYAASFAGTGTVASFTIAADPFGALSNNGALIASDLDEYQFGFEVAAAATPLPAALPLFATGLGGLGLLSWRRKRKAQAVA